MLVPGKGLQDNLQADLFLLVKVTNRKRFIGMTLSCVLLKMYYYINKKKKIKHVFASSFESSSNSW